MVKRAREKTKAKYDACRLADMRPLEQSNKDMRDAVDDLCATVRACQERGVTPTQYRALLMPLIETKLPKDWRLEWSLEKASLANEDVTFSRLLEFWSVNLKSGKVLTSQDRTASYLTKDACGRESQWPLDLDW